MSARPETELTVIASALAGNKPARLAPSDLTCPHRAAIWRTILTQHAAGKPTDGPTVLSLLDDSREEVGPILVHALREHYVTGDMEGYATILHKLAVARRRRKVTQELVEADDDHWETAFQRLTDMESRRNGFVTRALDIPSIVCDDIPETPWVIPGWLAEGDRIVLGGARKEGKSTLLADLAVALTSGTQWLGMKTRPARVLYVDEEQGDLLARQRIKRIIAGRGMSDEEIALTSTNLKYLHLNRFVLDVDEKRRQLEQEIVAHNAEFVFIDSLKRIHARDENSNDEMSKFFAHVLDPLIDRCRCGLLILHHVRKGQHDEETIVDALRGAGDIAAYVDTIWGYLREEDVRKLCNSLSRWDETGEPLLVTMVPTAGGEAFVLKGQSCDNTVASTLTAHVERARQTGAQRVDLVAALEDIGLKTDSAQREASRWLSRGRKNGDLCVERARGRVTVWSRFYAPSSVKRGP